MAGWGFRHRQTRSFGSAPIAHGRANYLSSPPPLTLCCAESAARDLGREHDLHHPLELATSPSITVERGGIEVAAAPPLVGLIDVPLGQFLDPRRRLRPELVHPFPGKGATAATGATKPISSAFLASTEPQQASTSPATGATSGSPHVAARLVRSGFFFCGRYANVLKRRRCCGCSGCSGFIG